MPNYCSDSPPQPSNAFAPSSYNRTIDSVTYFTCQLGFRSTLDPTPAYDTCVGYDFSAGQWVLSNNCTRMPICFALCLGLKHPEYCTRT